MTANHLSLVVILLAAQLFTGCSQVVDRLKTDRKAITLEGDSKVGTLSEPEAKAQFSDPAKDPPHPVRSKKVDESLTPLAGTKTAEVDPGNTGQVENRTIEKKKGSDGFSDTSRLNKF